MKAFSILFERCHGDSSQQKLHVFQFPKAASSLSLSFSLSLQPSLAPSVFSSYLPIPFLLLFFLWSPISQLVPQYQHKYSSSTILHSGRKWVRHIAFYLVSYSPVCLCIKDLIRRKLWMEAGLGLFLVGRTQNILWCLVLWWYVNWIAPGKCRAAVSDN